MYKIWILYEFMHLIICKIFKRSKLLKDCILTRIDSLLMCCNNVPLGFFPYHRLVPYIEIIEYVVMLWIMCLI